MSKVLVPGFEIPGNDPWPDPVEKYKRFEEDEYLLEDAPHVGEDDD